ncbi:MAG: hypothetical protein DBY04_00145 [Clostridiales bacterium]|nr:MAG: hypothetical protein DBY04_00145 [Clostridiales bacterium]
MGSGIDVKTDIVADADIYVDPADGIPVNFPDHIRRKGKKRDPFCGFQPFGGGNRYRGAVIFQTDFVLAEQKTDSLCFTVRKLKYVGFSECDNSGETKLFVCDVDLKLRAILLIVKKLFHIRHGTAGKADKAKQHHKNTGSYFFHNASHKGKNSIFNIFTRKKSIPVLKNKIPYAILNLVKGRISRFWQMDEGMCIFGREIYHKGEMVMTLVIMAAGMGSRFGGMKQLTPLTDEGEYIMDFTIYDALLAGFDRFILIIKEENEELFEEKIGHRLRRNGVSLRYAYQKMELPAGFVVPEGRTKPFGTGHAIMAAGRIDDNFGVVNADDCYGRDAFFKLASFLKEAKDDTRAHYCMVGYKVKNTLSENGSVSRGVCLADENGYLVRVEEYKKIERRADGTIINTFDDKSICALDEDTTVSMNCFGFTPSFTEHLEEMFLRFLEANRADLSKCEFFLPSEVQELIDTGRADVKILSTDAVWQGVTNRADSEIFRAFMREQKEHGVYPRHLWKN